MKNLIEYYYNFYNAKVIKEKEKMYIKYNNKLYEFKKTIRNKEEIIDIYNLSKKSNKYNKIILTNNNKIMINENNNNYLLEQINPGIINRKINIMDILKKEKVYDFNKYKYILRTNWYNLWIKKIDYITYQRAHIKEKYLILDQYIDYYLGLSENAISYINSTANLKKDERDIPVIAHRRIYSDTAQEYYETSNIILDHYTRDICEYVKYIFFYQKFDYNIISTIINSIDLSEYGWGLLYARMLFPTYFFDLYDTIINEEKEEIKIGNLINRIEEYEKLLNYMYKEINKKTRIPSIGWISS